MKILFIGGGTAGHIDPALAVAQECKRTTPSWVIEFLGSNKGLEKGLIPQAGYRLHTINKAPLPRNLSLKNLVFPFTFTLAFAKSLVIILRFDAVVGFGGYVAPPAYLAAKVLGKKIFIHEANAKPGFANRLGARIATKIFTAFTLQDSLFSTAHVVGMPLKPEIIEASGYNANQREALRSEYLSSLGLDTKRPVIVVMGGSSGSQKINSVIEETKSQFIDNGFSILHSVGASGELDPEAHYYPTHYFYEMGNIYLVADFIISRSGAVTTAELDLMGVPALLIPLAIGNGEQKFNAEVLVKKEMARLISNSDFNAQRLLDEMDWIGNMCRIHGWNKRTLATGSVSPHKDASQKIVAELMKELN